MHQKTLDYLENFLMSFDQRINDDDVFKALICEELEEAMPSLMLKTFFLKDINEIWDEGIKEFKSDLGAYGVDFVLRRIWNQNKRMRERLKHILPKMFEMARRVSWKVEGDVDTFLERIKDLQNTLKLSDMEVDVLVALIAFNEEILQPVANRFNDNSVGLKIFTVSRYLKITEGAIVSLLEPRKALRRYRCLDCDLDISYHLRAFFTGVENEPFSSYFYRMNREPVLPWSDFADLTEKHGAILKRLLMCQSKPVNILLYGAPGTGKTSFAKTLVDAVGKTSYSIAQRMYDSDDQSCSTPEFRFCGLHVCDEQIDPAQSIIIVDEADDMLRGRASFGMMGGQPHGGDKGMLNSVLDDLKTSTIWITNTPAEELDESSRRRFDYSICFAPLNSEQRKRIWKNNIVRMKLKRFFTDALVDELADRYPVSAGGIAQTLENLVKVNPKKSEVPTLIDQLMKPHCELMGVNRANDKLQPVKDYSLDGLNLQGEVKLDRIVEAVRSFQRQAIGKTVDPDRPRMNLLLSGPPGTGKTEFVKYLGSVLKTKINVKMGSDLLSMWLGGTEENIKSAFAEAEAEHAILFLDEIDGLVQSRTNAVRSWEVTQVNELLYWMENFNGVMIGATNFLQNLDQAIMRRFTFKLQFDYLDETGKRTFFEKCFKTTLTDGERRRLAMIPSLAPGDFRTVRQSLFYYGGDVTNAMRLEGLERESAAKNSSPFAPHARLGF
ncbi:MAG: ATP-binding protein [Victivallales bacterium]|nr:ATP-binding protein [Victivallales bacterium]